MDGYTFDSGEFQRVREIWGVIRAELENDESAAAGVIDAVKAPGHEPASGFVAQTQNTSGKALLSCIAQLKAFADGYLNNLGQAQGDYQAQEDHVTDIFENRMR